MMEKLLTNISRNISEINYKISECADKYNRDIGSISVMAVTKTIPFEAVNEAINNGIKLLGENRAQELAKKYDGYKIKKDGIHFIGHLQTNKLKSIIDKVSVIQSIDSFHLLDCVNNLMKKTDSCMDCLVQINIGNEPTKFGVSAENLLELLKKSSELECVKIKGLMAIPPAANSDLYFGKMQNLFVDILSKNMDNINMQVLSMGMSNDYCTAIKYSSTLLRIGRGIFGDRIKQPG